MVNNYFTMLIKKIIMEFKFYLTWSEEKPKHPKEVYKQSWNTGLSWYGQINPQDKSFNEWKNDQIEKYKRLHRF